jgi:hypothetical protein
MVLLLLAGLADGIGLSAMLPMLNLAFQDPTRRPSATRRSRTS